MKNKNDNSYFKNRSVDFENNSSFFTPRYLLKYLPKNKDAHILDIGCGLGNFIGDCAKTHNRTNVKGIDISRAATQFTQSKGLPVELIEDIKTFASTSPEKYDFILMSHVLEHLPKDEMILTLKLIKDKLLKKNGCIFIVVPNAQSATNAYWAYEDFTHNTLFTTGSLDYVLKDAGYKEIEFVDLDGFMGQKEHTIKIKKFFLNIYKRIKKFEMYITNSYYHKPSPISYAWEIKAVAFNK